MDENPYKAHRSEGKMVARFKIFESHHESWATMSQKVTDFLTELGPNRVIGVSHSQESNVGTIVVWYWE